MNRKKQKESFLFCLYVVIFSCAGSLLHGCTLAAVLGLSLQWLLLLQSMGSRLRKCQQCGTQAQQLWYMGSVTYEL